MMAKGEELLSAIRGHHVVDHYLAVYACEFGELHRRLRDHPEDKDVIDAARTALIAEVDRWVAERQPPGRAGTPIYRETLGAVIDRIAAAQVTAYHLLMTLDPADPQIRAAWTHLARLVDGYTDLRTEVECGQRRLPLSEGQTK